MSRRLNATLGVVAAALVTVAAAGAAGGELDAQFGSGGKVVTDFGASDHALAVAVQRDGKIVAAGLTMRGRDASDVALARYDRDGTLDTSFDGDGRVVTDLGGVDSAQDVALQRDGKLVVGGNTSGRFFLARYTANGSLDAGFGSDGTIETDVGFAGGFHRVLVQPNGKIVAVGSDSRRRSVLARYLADGTLDASFGEDGVVLPDLAVRDAALAGPGRVVVAGTRLDRAKQRNGDGLPVDLLVARYRADGTLDPTFSRDGIASFDLRRTNCCYVEAIAVQPNGGILVGGYGELSGAPVVARLRSNGTPDVNFGREGQTVTLGSGAGVGGLAVDARGRIVVTIRMAGRGDFGVARLTPAGDIDHLFAHDAVTTDFGAQDDSWAVALQPDRKIVVAGYSGGGLFDSSAPNDFALARYLVPRCAVPNLRRATLRGAREALALAGCRLGAVRRVVSRSVNRGRVISQRPAPGADVPEDARVSVVVGR